MNRFLIGKIFIKFLRFSVPSVVSFCVVCCLLCGTSCHSIQDVVYVQGSEYSTLVNNNDYISKIKPGDKLSIIVNSKVPEVTQVFNMELLEQTLIAGGVVSTGSGYYGSPQTFEVNADGYINYPIFGLIKVDEKNRYQLQEEIKQLIVDNNYVKDPTVVINHTNRKYSVLGEVTSPGSFTDNMDRITVFDALSRAGDMTIMGDRHHVKLVRENHGKITSTNLDLTDKDIISSPYFYLEPNDILYVEPIHSQANNRIVSTLHNFYLTLIQTGVNIGRYIQRSTR